MKYIRSLCTLLFGVAVILFFGLAYPHHLHFQEQFQLFLFDSSYVWEIIKLPGGISDLLGRFCTQFFLYAWVGAVIIGVLLSVVQLLTLRLVGKGWFYGLSYVPSFLLWLFLLDENALLGGIWAVILTLLASWAYAQTTKRPNDQTTKRLTHILLIAAIPLLYWMAGPVCIVFFLLVAAGINGSYGENRKKKANGTVVWNCGALVVLAIMIVILSYFLPVPASKLWYGIHYYRYPTVIPVLLWSATLSILIIALIVRTLKARQRNDSSYRPLYYSSTISFVLVAIVMGCLVWKNSNFKAEKVMQYDFMACHQQWNRILATANAEKPNNQIGVTVQNLALAMHGMLADHLFEYNQNGILGLLPDVERDATSPLPTAEAFYQLGMINVAQRTVFEAQEAILDFQKSGRCYKRLAQTNLINGSYEVARKYLTALQKTLFYSDWANETMQLLGDEKTIAKHPEYGHLRQFAYNEDFFFSDHVTPEMLESLYFNNTDNRLAFEYLRAYYMLTGDRDSYAKLLLHTSTKQ